MRASQFIYFLSLQKVGKDDLSQFSHLTVGENLRVVRRRYRKDAKQKSKEKKNG